MVKITGHDKIIKQLTFDNDTAKKESNRVTFVVKEYPPLYLLQNFASSVSAFIKSNKLEEIVDPLSFSKMIQDSFRKHKGDEKAIKKEVDEFIDIEMKKTSTSFIVTTEVHGVDPGEEIVSLGDFKIANCEKTKQLLTEEIPIVIKKGHIDNELIEGKIYISIKIVAKSSDLAFGIWKKQMEEFEYIFRLVLGTDTNGDLGVFNFLETKVSESIVLSDMGLKLYGEPLQTNVAAIMLNDNFFKHPQIIKLLSLVCKVKRSELENNIIKAGVWAGKALKERDINIAIPELSFGLETLLGNRSTSFTNPSITFKTSSLGAFIYSEDYNERISCKEQIKTFYKVRSKIVHGNDEIVEKKDFVEWVNIMRKIIFNLLSKEQFLHMATLKELDEWYDTKVLS
ncbi:MULTISPECIES: HEPN domain-containing protein [Listeria]|uniref:Uncharacterized protein n=1 Tax=Listeria monocytogenes TaxID=1639 RepID=A0A466GJA9_LISMN|nr:MULTISPECIES: HEPN domain-containing protein [Listeria]EAC2277220.1 hypothetical protein [Listeria monocytogenes]EAC2292016.1 hypothetical protein [Listeria monocytogenes]EAC2304418.1 hypothetical protein [Listeria monocytogenes]EAC2780773.1 hypothetical protein [Listeria monocytogenes]EAC3010713.1 hypothetical protein [Listeria monocytogenes]